MPAPVLPEEIHNQGASVIGNSKNNPPSFKRLDGKVAIITGGARGIGEAAVKLFAEHGAKVVIADIEDTLGTALADSLSPAVTYMHCDVSSEKDIINLIESTVSLYGKLDILFNNAGIMGNRNNKSIINFDADDFDRIMSVNVKSVALGIKHAASVMIPRGGGSIISTSSVAGVVGGCSAHIYTASKHAIVGLTKNTACELGNYGIRVNCVSPFGVATPMLIDGWKHKYNIGDDEDAGMSFKAPSEEEVVERTDEYVRRFANLKGVDLKAEDIAEAALYLAGDESKYISGHNLVVDGGITTIRKVVLS